MKVRLLHTQGQGEFAETSWDLPDLGDYQIRVQAVMTGVCRSDIDMMKGNFGPLPLHMQGHEGLGRVVAVGSGVNDFRQSEVNDVEVGDYVATRGEPAYADFYNCEYGTYVRVPEAAPRYILEPVACGINIVYQNLSMLRKIKQTRQNPRLAILGTGFLAWVAYHTLRNLKVRYPNTEVIGRSNSDLWSPHCTLSQELHGRYDVIIDLSSNTEYFNQPVFAEQALVIVGSEKSPPVTTSFSNLLWNSCTVSFPSPRNAEFITCMTLARDHVQQGLLDVDRFWTKSYNRDTHWRDAFEDGCNRPQGYSRGYIVW